MTQMIGHNRGPELEGVAWRTRCWSVARRQLLPTLPIEVLRRRVRRAAEVGLDYKTYATVHATTGRDIMAILFSTNALRLIRAEQSLGPEWTAKLAAIKNTQRRALTIAPLTPASLEGIIQSAENVLDSAAAAPHVHASWAQAARDMDAARPHNMPADALLLVGDTAMEQEWSTAGRLAGYLTAARFFTNATR
jgi:hypothetical protein